MVRHKSSVLYVGCCPREHGGGKENSRNVKKTKKSNPPTVVILTIQIHIYRFFFCKLNTKAFKTEIPTREPTNLVSLKTAI